MREEKKKKEEIEWDKKKIVLFVITLGLLVIIGINLKPLILGEEEVSNTNKKESVRAASTQDLSIKRDVSNQIQNLKEQAGSIDVVDIATSSPQVQKVINDLKALQDYPASQIRQTCEKICSGL